MTSSHTLFSSTTETGATLSTCRRYRYQLWRGWGDRSHRCAFVGINPSTADESKDDPTIRKCIGFAKRWGFGAIDMVNLFGWRSTDPSGLLAVDDPVGPDNDVHIAEVFDGAHRIVWCWGRHNARVRALVQQRLLASGWHSIAKKCETGTLGHSQDGSPRHPLMLPYATPFTVQR